MYYISFFSFNYEADDLKAKSREYYVFVNFPTRLILLDN